MKFGTVQRHLPSLNHLPKTTTHQRGRWLAAQYRYGKRFAKPAIAALLTKGNLDFFNKTLQMALPPRLILPGVLAMGALVQAGSKALILATSSSVLTGLTM